jgi:cadmium resistance protein CadD (predicted permease)
MDELLGLLIILSGLMVLLAKEKEEDELTLKIRLESLLRAVIWSYGILLFAIVFIYGQYFFSAMMINMFTILILFTIRFNWKLYQLRKMEGRNEE